MCRESLSLLNILEGYIRNYRKLNLFQATNKSMYTKREIGYFETVGEYLGFFLLLKIPSQIMIMDGLDLWIYHGGSGTKE